MGLLEDVDDPGRTADADDHAGDHVLAAAHRARPGAHRHGVLR